MRLHRLALAALLLAGPCTGWAHTVPAPGPLAPVRSMGMPPTWKPFTGDYCAVDRRDDDNRTAGAAFVGIQQDLVPSVAGFGVSAEGCAGGCSGVAGLNGGVRALAESRGIFMKVGIGYDFQRQHTSTIISFTLPIRRGGLFGCGTHLRIDFLPDRGNWWAVGVQIPLELHMGNTQLFVTREALAALARDHRTQDAIANQVAFSVKEGAAFDSEGLAKGGVDIAPLVAPYLAAFRDLPADLRERTVLYMTVGSQNKDARGIMTDGEVLQVTAGPWALWVVSDMWMLAGSTTWLESQEDLDRLLRPNGEWQRRIGRWLRKVL